jgi:putative transposase
VERDFLAKRSEDERPGPTRLVDRNDRAISIRRQCELLGIARSGLYRPRRAANDNDLPLMRRIDELFTTWPLLGSRRLTALLRTEGHSVNRKRVQRLMRKMGIAALGPGPRTTKLADLSRDRLDTSCVSTWQNVPKRFQEVATRIRGQPSCSASYAILCGYSAGPLDDRQAGRFCTSVFCASNKQHLRDNRYD